MKFRNKFFSSLKTAGKYSLYLLTKKATWLAISAGLSYFFTTTDDEGNLLVDPVLQGNADFILHGIEVIVCAFMDGCS